MHSPERGLVLGTAGHVDHGKTTLVKALTGKDTDRLPEERRRGLTIELGFSELQLPDGRSLGIVDVPGHERFVATMVAGAGGVDLFLMAIAADDGVMPQTHEHRTILKTLGVTRGVIALTKCDLASDAARVRARGEVRVIWPDVPVVEVCAPTGSGLSELRDALTAVARDLESARSRHEAQARSTWPEPAVLHVDRVFTIRGAGTVVTGTLWSGELQRGDRIAILPRGRIARIRRVHSHDREIECATPGRRVALNLVGVGRGEIDRGDVMTTEGSGMVPTHRLDCQLNRTEPVEELAGERVQLHHGTRAVPARLIPFDGEHGQLRLEGAVVARAGDRFVLRRIAPVGTVGGGVVVDAHPRRHGADEGLRLLRLIESGGPDEILAAALKALPTGISRDPVAWGGVALLGAARDRFSAECWEDELARIEQEGQALRRGGRLIPAPPRPLRPAGVDLDATTPLARRALELLVDDGRRPRSPRDLAEALDAPHDAVTGALDGLAEADKLVRVKTGVYYPPSCLADVHGVIDRLVARAGSVSIAELRDELGVSRKYAQALLEHLDGQGRMTRRGDRHYPRRSP